MKDKFIQELTNLKLLIDSKPDDKHAQKKSVFNFSSQKIEFHNNSIKASITRIKNLSLDLMLLIKDDQNNKSKILMILDLIEKDLIGKIDQIISLVKLLKEKQKVKALNIKIPTHIPVEIKPDVTADLKELEKAYNAGCYRASTIICGRILETGLHRKYYEATGVDILEKNPGIGLGKLIAKLSEKNVKFDPGLTQQIHLINQVRIYSVHVKKESFYPSDKQTYAMILYTLDVLSKMF
jgi:hypothetical protein